MSKPAMNIDLTSPAYFDDPYPTWAQLRAEAPVSFADGFWQITSYAQSVAALRDPRFSSDRTDAHLAALTPSERDRVTYYAALRRGMMLFTDPPNHTRLRRLVARAFTPRAAEALRPRIQQITDELLAAAPADFDAIRDLALPLPYYVIAELIGIPREDRAQVKRWSTDFGMSVFGNFTAEIALQADASLRAFAEYLRPIVARLRTSPEPNLFQTLIAAEEDGEQLSEDELFATAMLLIIAGHETTTTLLGNALWLLLSHPAQLQLLRNDLNFVEGLLHETLRYRGPAVYTARVATEEVAFGGQVIAKGERVLILLSAANRDPAIFADPEHFTITRDPNPHLGFGDYIHKCLGAPLALVEGQVVFRTLLSRYPQLRLAATPPTWQPLRVPGGHGLQSLPLELG